MFLAHSQASSKLECAGACLRDRRRGCHGFDPRFLLPSGGTCNLGRVEVDDLELEDVVSETRIGGPVLIAGTSEK